MKIISTLFFLAGIISAYAIVVRPIIRSHHFLDKYFEREEGLWQSLEGFRTKAIAMLLMIATGLVEAYDWVSPLVGGVDWTPITAEVPAWVWPILMFAMAGLFSWLRKITSREPAPTAPPPLQGS